MIAAYYKQVGEYALGRNAARSGQKHGKWAGLGALWLGTPANPSAGVHNRRQDENCAGGEFQDQDCPHIATRSTKPTEVLKTGSKRSPNRLRHSIVKICKLSLSWHHYRMARIQTYYESEDGFSRPRASKLHFKKLELIPGGRLSNGDAFQLVDGRRTFSSASLSNFANSSVDGLAPSASWV